MKQLGKRILSMTLAVGLTASMLVSNLTVMPVWAAGSTEYGAEETTALGVTEEVVEFVLETSEEHSVAETVSEEVVDQTGAEEEVSSEEVVAGEKTEEESAVPAIDTEETTVTEETVVEDTSEATESETATVVEETGEMVVEGDGTEVVNQDSVSDNCILEVQDGKLVNKGSKAPSGEVVIPAGTLVIPEDRMLFTNNTAVTKVTFSDDLLTTIEKYAFQGAAITEITIPGGVTTIGEGAFTASDLEEVTLKAEGSMINIGNDAFSKCISLSTVYTNKRIKSLGEQAFYSCSSLNNDKYDSLDLTGVQSIGEKAFAKCTSLQFVIIPDSVTTIEKETFSGCSALGTFYDDNYKGVKAVQLGNGVTTIKDQAFEGCTGLEEVELPAQIGSLGSYVFNGAEKLKKVVIRNVSGEEGDCAISLTYTSFPLIKGLTLYSYDGTVVEWIGNHSQCEIKHVSLYKDFDIKIGKMTNGTVTANVTKAKKGMKIQLTVTPEEGYVLRYGSVVLKDDDGVTINPSEVEFDDWENTFKMPEKAVTVYADFVETASVKYGTALQIDSLKAPTNNKITYDAEKKNLSFPKPWQYVSIVVEGNNGTNNYPGYAELVFTSKNSNIASVDKYGKIKAVGAGTTTITVALADEEKAKVTKELTFTVDVGDPTYVEKLSLTYKAPNAVKKLVGVDAEATTAGMDILEYRSSWLKTYACTITVTPEGLDGKNEKLHTKYVWSSLDEGIAKPAGKNTTGDENTITIPKNALGETVITVKANDGSEEPVEKQFVVRVIDDTPRLAISKVTVDPQSDTGTKLDLVSVYGGRPDIEELTIVKKTGNNKYESADELFDLVKINSVVYLKIKSSEMDKFDAGKNYTYKDVYYLHGIMSGTDTEFYIPIPTLVICKKNIKLSVKTSGKINLFYNGTADQDKIGVVKVTQNQKDLVMKDCYLVGKEKTNGLNVNDDNAFTENFTVDFDYEEQTIVIRRTIGDEALSCYTDGSSKGKPVLSGELWIEYEGYAEPMKVKNFKVPTYTTAPSYKLDTTKISLHYNAVGQEFDVSFIEKKTGKVEDFTDKTAVIVESGTTRGLLADTFVGSLGKEELVLDTENDTFKVKIEESKKGKIVVVLNQSDWEPSTEWNKRTVIKATINVSATKADPKVKLGKSTLTVNNQSPAATDYTTIKMSHVDAMLTEVKFEPYGTKQDEDINVYYDEANGIVVAELNGDVDKGVYNFKAEDPAPEYVYAGREDRSIEAKPVKIKVKVLDTEPSIKLKSTTFTLNANAQKTDGAVKFDSVTRDFSWVNLPTEYSDYTLSEEGTITPKSQSKSKLLDGLKVELDGVNKQIKVYIESEMKYAVSESYIVDGLKLKNGSDEIAVKPFTITVKSIDKDPTVKVTAKGNINPLDPASQIVYTPKISNINGGIEDVELLEIDEEDGAFILDSSFAHFEAVHDFETGKTIVRVKEGAELENRAYRIKLFYSLENGDGVIKNPSGTYEVDKVQTIKLKQTMPKITVDKKSADFFAGDKTRTQIVKVTKKSTTTAQISDVVFSSKTPETLQNAFEIVGFDADSGKMELKLKNSAFIKQGVEQTLTFEIVCDGQLKNTTGTTFTLKVKVVK